MRPEEKKLLIKYGIYGLIFSALFPIVLGLILNIPGGSLTIGGEGDWVGFFGSYIGAIVGSAVTVVIFMVTISYNRERDSQEKIRFEKQVEDEKLRFTAQLELEKERFQEQLNAEQERHNDQKAASIMPYIKAMDLKDAHSTRMYSFVFVHGLIGDQNGVITEHDFEIENVGLGTAVHLKIGTLSGFPDDNQEEASIVIQRGEKVTIGLMLIYPESEWRKYDFAEYMLEVRFSDLMGNKYKQIITFANAHVNPDKTFKFWTKYSFIPERIYPADVGEPT